MSPFERRTAVALPPILNQPKRRKGRENVQIESVTWRTLVGVGLTDIFTTATKSKSEAVRSKALALISGYPHAARPISPCKKRRWTHSYTRLKDCLHSRISPTTLTLIVFLSTRHAQPTKVKSILFVTFFALFPFSSPASLPSHNQPHPPQQP